MNDRIDEALDGELPESQLTPGERARLDGTRKTLDEVTAVLRSAPAPDLTNRVMDALAAREARAPGSWKDAMDWLLRPRLLVWRPVYAFALLLLLFVPLALVVLGDTEANVAVVAEPTTSADPVQVFVQFRFQAPGASQVALAGSFTEWAPEIRLDETTPGVWSALVPLEPGVHDYTFVIDGQQWVPDPAAPQVDDGFGGTNSRLFLTTPAGNV